MSHMREGGARALLNDLITQVQALATVVSAGQENNTLPEMMGAELVKLDEVKAALTQLGAAFSAPDQLLPYVDGLEALVASTNSKLDALFGAVDTLEAIGGVTNTLLTAANTLLTAIRDGQARQAPWNAIAAGGSLIVGTTAALLKAAAGADKRNRVTNIQIANTNALTVARVEILDDGTVIWSVQVPAGTTLSFNVDLIGSVNKPLNARLVTALTGGVMVNAQGTVSN